MPATRGLCVAGIDMFLCMLLVSTAGYFAELLVTLSVSLYAGRAPFCVLWLIELLNEPSPQSAVSLLMPSPAH